MTEHESREELLLLISAELDEAQRARSRHGTGIWAIGAGLSGLVWLVLDPNGAYPAASAVLALIVVFTLGIDLLRHVFSPGTVRSQFQEERYQTMRIIGGGQPSFLAECAKYLLLALAALVARQALGVTLAVLLIGYFAFWAALTGLFIVMLRFDIPLPNYDFRAPRSYDRVLRGARIIGFTLFVFGIASTGEYFTEVGLPVLRLAGLLTATLILLVMLAQELDTDVSASDLIDIRRALVLQEINFAVAKERTEEALLGVRPSRFALPSGSRLFAMMQEIKDRCGDLISRVEAGETGPNIAADWQGIESDVRNVISAIDSRFRLTMWAFSAAHELELGIIALVRRLKANADEVDRWVARARDAVTRSANAV